MIQTDNTDRDALMYRGWSGGRVISTGLKVNQSPLRSCQATLGKRLAVVYYFIRANELLLTILLEEGLTAPVKKKTVSESLRWCPVKIKKITVFSKFVEENQSIRGKLLAQD